MEILRRSVLLALFALATFPLSSDAGELEPALSAVIEDLRTNGSPTDRIHVFVQMADSADLSDLPTLGINKDELREEAVRRLKEVHAESMNTREELEGCDVGTSMNEELSAMESSLRGTVRERSWLQNGVSVDVEWPLVEIWVARSDVAEIRLHRSQQGVSLGAVSPPASAAIAGPHPDTRFAEAHARGYFGSGSRVGIIDAGVDGSHQDLAPNLLKYADNSPVWLDPTGASQTPTDPYGQGTFFAGIAAGERGGAPDAKWSACRALVESNGAFVLDDDHLDRCLRFLIDPVCYDQPESAFVCPMGRELSADVVLLGQWFQIPGTCLQNDLLTVAVRRLREAGVLPVFASGTDPSGHNVMIDPVLTPPGNMPEVFGVGPSYPSITTILHPASYLGTAECSLPVPGPTATPPRSQPRVFSPGYGVASAWPSPSGDTYRYLDENEAGVAAAHVAAAAALVYPRVDGLFDNAPTEKLALVERAISRSADAQASYFIGMDPVGRLNADAAVTFEDAVAHNVILPGCDPGDNPDPECLNGTPTILTADRRRASVSFVNNGLTTWQPGSHYLLLQNSPWHVVEPGDLPYLSPGPCFPPSQERPLETGRVELNGPVLPGEIATFTFDVDAPLIANTASGYPFSAQLRSGGKTIGSTFAQSVKVGGTYCSRFKSLAGLDNVVAGDIRIVSMKFRNSGTVAWNPGSIYLTPVGGTENHWGILQPNGTFSYSGALVELPDEVPPCTAVGHNTSLCEAEFILVVKAPTAVGSYPFRFSAFYFGFIVNFYFGDIGPSDDYTVDVSGTHKANIPALGAASWGLPGSSRSISVTVTNPADGHRWAGSQYCLQLKQWYWGGAQKCLGPFEWVNPGQSKTFVVNYNLPQTSATYALSVQMKRNAGFFGQSRTVPGGIDVVRVIQASQSWPYYRWNGQQWVHEKDGWEPLHIKDNAGTRAPMDWSHVISDCAAYYTPENFWCNNYLQPGNWERNHGRIWSDGMLPKANRSVLLRWTSDVPNRRALVWFGISDRYPTCNGKAGDGAHFRYRFNDVSNPANNLESGHGVGPGIPPDVVFHDIPMLSIGDTMEFELYPLGYGNRCDETNVDPQILVFP